MSSDLGPDCEEILAGRPFYLRAGMSVSTGMGVRERGWTGRRACVCERRTLPMPATERGWGGYYLRQLPGALFGAVLGE